MPDAFASLVNRFACACYNNCKREKKTVGELVAALDGNQPNVSKHLALLHDAGLIAKRRAATTVVYCISDPMIFKLCDLVCRSETSKTKRHLRELTRNSS